VVLVSRDLLARGRVTEAADAAGVSLITTPPDAPESLPPAPDLVLLDLDAMDATTIARFARSPGRVLGYYSHVDVDLGDAAGRAGVEALPRGRLWRELPQILAGLPTDGPRSGSDRTEGPR
jgi:hypothetical protein